MIDPTVDNITKGLGWETVLQQGEIRFIQILIMLRLRRYRKGVRDLPLSFGEEAGRTMHADTRQDHRASTHSSV